MANVSLRTSVPLVPSPGGHRSADPLLVDGQVDAGQAVDAGGADRDPGAGRRRPGRRRWPGRGCPGRPPGPHLVVGGAPPPRPRTAPFRSTRSTSVLEAPPSTASTAGSVAVSPSRLGRPLDTIGHVRFADRGRKGSPWSAVGAPTRPSSSRASATTRTASWSTSSSCWTPMPPGSSRWPGFPSASWPIVAGPADCAVPETRWRPWRGRTSSSSSCGSAGQEARHSDETLPVATAAWVRRRPGPGAWPRRCARCPSSSSWPSSPRPGPRRGPGWSTSRTRSDRHPGPGRRGAPGPGSVQRGPVGPTAGRPLLGVSPDDVELEHVGLNHLTWVRSVRVGGTTGCPSSSNASGRDRARERLAPRPAQAVGGLALLLPPLLLRAGR